MNAVMYTSDVQYILVYIKNLKHVNITTCV